MQNEEIVSDNELEYRIIKDLWFSMDEDDRFKFIEKNVKIETSKGRVIPIKLEEFQKRWFRDGPLFNDYTTITEFKNRICLKCRNIGASYVLIAIEAVLTCWVYPHVFIPVVATKEKQAQEIIRSCKKVIRHLDFNINLTTDLDKQTVSNVKYANGSLIEAFPGGNPGGIRGARSMCSYVDESAFIEKQQEVMSAIEYFHTEGGQMNLLSTPWGKNNLFWKIWSDFENFKGWKRHFVGLFKNPEDFDVTKPIPDQIMNRGLRLNAPWLSVSFLENKRLQDAPFNYANFLQETCGIPIDEVSRAIPEELLNVIKMDHYYVEERPRLPDGTKDPDKTYVISADFGADNNVTAIVVAEATAQNKLVPCYTETFKGLFPEQITKIKHIVNKFNPKYFLGDSTGMGGTSFMSTLQNEIGDGIFVSSTTNGSNVIGINYSKKDIAAQAGVNDNNKSFMINTMIRLLSEGKVIVPKNLRALREEILGVEKFVYDSYVKYSGKNGMVGRDDLAMSFFQLAISYDMLFENDMSDSIGGAEYNFGKDTKKPSIKSSEFYECSAVSNPIKREKITGFSKLI